MHQLPTGTVTFLFTDIEGSTRLLQELGDGYAEALLEHRRALRKAFGHHGGVEVDTQGDAFFIAFARATDAIAAARAANAALQDGPIRVRIGLHTGEPIATDAGYVGIDVHRAARIAAAGHGGQILISQSTRDLVDPEELHDLGNHRLKDLTELERIYQLGDDEFPPLKSLNQSNLPEQPTPFVGRQKELPEVLQLVLDEDVRLLTLTGPGGSGKTRLAVQAAAEAVDEHEHGVWWVGLQGIRDPELVMPTIASTLGAKSDPAKHIGSRNMLLVLDNLEHVVAAAPALGKLLAACPNLKLLATSRERLHLGAEKEYAVPPFAEQESVGFFLERARSVRTDFEPDDHVIEICRRLDHLPLALELAAARVRALSARQILERLERSLPLLTGGTRDAPERQRTLRATIEWSYQLLSPEEQRIFRHLGPFSGGSTLEAAEEVAGADLDLMQSLVEKSLLWFDGDRYSLLETIREFALECLEETGEADAARRRHLDFFLRLAGTANTSAEANYGHRYDLLLPEQANLRAAIDAAVAFGDIATATEFMVMLENFWATVDPFEGARRFEGLLDADQLPDLLRARALRCYAGSLFLSGQYEHSHRVTQQSLALFRALGDERGQAVLLHRIGLTTLQLGDGRKARELLEESLRIFRRLGMLSGEAEAIGGLGYVAQYAGDVERATELFSRSSERAAEIGFLWWQVGMSLALVECLMKLGRIDEAEAKAREELVMARTMGDRRMTFFGLAQAAWIASARGDLGRAGRFWGALEAEEARAPVGQWEDERDAYAARVLGAGDPELERSRQAGRGLSFEGAVDEALS